MSFARVRALAVVGILVISAAVVVAVTFFKDHQRGPLVGSTCPDGAIVVDLQLPEEKDIKLNVLNTTDRPGVATSLGTEFKSRKFQVLKQDNEQRKVTTSALLRYGPKAVAAAWVLRAYFLNDVQMEFDIKRTDDSVDVLIGSKYKQLASVSQVHQGWAALGKPDLPAGTCEAPKQQ